MQRGRHATDYVPLESTVDYGIRCGSYTGPVAMDVDWAVVKCLTHDHQTVSLTARARTHARPHPPAHAPTHTNTHTQVSEHLILHEGTEY